MNDELLQIQSLLLSWIKSRDKVSYNKIKEACEYLNMQYSLCFKKPIYKIFSPLFYSGVIDYAGQNMYAATPYFSVTNDSTTIICNPIDNFCDSTGVVGFYRSKSHATDSFFFKSEAILKKIPSIDKIIKSYPVGILDDVESIQYDGIIKQNDNITKYFIIKEQNLVVKIPSATDNPDAIHMAYYYQRILNGKNIGKYNEDTKILQMCVVGLPIIIYRILLVETLFGGYVPISKSYNLKFHNISNNIVKQLNRIFIKAIHYE